MNLRLGAIWQWWRPAIKLDFLQFSTIFGEKISAFSQKPML
jgi:hypothetical protein